MEKYTEKYVPRKLEEEIIKYIQKKEIIAVLGARQAGKTTLLKRIFENIKSDKKVFLDFEDRETLQLFINDIKSFSELYVKDNEFLFIDEFQYAKEGGKQLKYLFDEYPIKIFISGSSATELSIQSVKYLVGRIFVFTLFPFSFEEFFRHKENKLYGIYIKEKKLSAEIINKINKLYEEFILYGGYPRVVLSEDKAEKEVVLKNIYNTYLLKEIKEILSYKEDYKLVKLINALALQVGGMINYDELSRTTGFNYKELLDAINILKKTFIISESRPYYKNARTELVKSPKIYFIDNGFRNYIIKNFQKSENRTDLGMLNENFAASELIKKELDLRYWRTKSGAEVDFIIKINGEIIPIEAKSRLSKIVINKSIHSFIDKYSPKKLFVASWNISDKKRIFKTEVTFLPLFSLSKFV